MSNQQQLLLVEDVLDLGRSGDIVLVLRGMGVPVSCSFQCQYDLTIEDDITCVAHGMCLSLANCRHKQWIHVHDFSLALRPSCLSKKYIY